MVPAMRVFKASVAKRVIGRMPDSPAVSLAQLSVLPAPSEVMTPSPVTTTVGRPCLSFADGIVLLLTRPLRPAPDLRPANVRLRSPRPGAGRRPSAAPVQSSPKAETA